MEDVITQSDIERMSFKEASNALETTVRKLESGGLELEESLAAYKNGVKLYKNLKERLAKAQEELDKVSPQEAQEGGAE